MSILDRTLPLDVPIALALAWAGTYAVREGRDEAALATRELASLLDGEAVTVSIDVRKVLCHACDHFRAAGSPEIVERLEKIIALLQQGCPPRVVRAGISLGMTPEMVAKISGV